VSVSDHGPRGPAIYAPVRVRNRYLLVLDAALLSVAGLFAFALRFEGFEWPPPYVSVALVFLAVSVPCRLLVFYGAGLYRRLWHQASISELEPVLAAGLLGAAVSVVLGILVLPLIGLIPTRVPFSVAGFDALMTGAAIAVPRLTVRMVGSRHQRRRRSAGRATLIVGAGQAGQLTARELFAHAELELRPIGFVDDDRTKHGHVIQGLPVLGSLSSIAALVRSYDVTDVIIAMPAAPGTVVREVTRHTLAAGAKPRILPPISEILSGRIDARAVRQVEIQDLLRREPVHTDLAIARALVSGRRILVTGAGGSIGSEICRQVARLDPAELVLLGHGENSIFEIRQELAQTFPDLNVRTVIADIRDRRRMVATIQHHVPEIVYHAAAHKHVPLMEGNVAEAIANNVMGTRNLVDAAMAVGTPRFVLISSDKAVRPTSVMGATKRAAEQVVQRAAHLSDLSYVAVRFGNVLGSRGSVVPTFLRQIRAGGPVTVTHPEMMRYFMTIPEAVHLVLQAAAIGRGGEVFVLEMGQPVRIVDLARDLIRLSGLEVGADIDLVFTGIRPGEKLSEEVFFAAEEVLHTSHPSILRTPANGLSHTVDRSIDELIAAAVNGAPEDELRRLLRCLVPEYLPAPVDGSRAPAKSAALPHRVAAPLIGDATQR
jgi:FlaA1/EpsC-like NDP-sugar epimerase